MPNAPGELREAFPALVWEAEFVDLSLLFARFRCFDRNRDSVCGSCRNEMKTNRDALKSWPGAMVVVSHDRDFIDTIGVSSEIKLGASGSNEPLRR